MYMENKKPMFTKPNNIIYKLEKVMADKKFDLEDMHIIVLEEYMHISFVNIRGEFSELENEINSIPRTHV